MVEDKELIRQYAVEKSEAAFAELVQRHVGMVYAAALRQVNGDAHLAQDLAQTVFSELAAKAGLLQGANSIAGWLYTHTRFAAVKAVRTETRRRAREQAVFAMNETNTPTAGGNELRPLMDEALSELGEADREAIVLRFFESYEFSRVGAALGVSENAARMRVDRALEKLRAALQKRGLATTSAALAGLLAETPPAAVTAQLAVGIARTALRYAAAASTPSATSLAKLIAMKKASFVVAGALALALAAVVALHHSSDSVSPTGAPPSAKANPATLVNSDAAGQSADAKPDLDPFQKVVRRHDEQLKAHQGDAADEARARWEKEVAEFDDTMKDEPGVKKFGKKIQITIKPDQAIVAGGWEIAPGKTLMIAARPGNGNGDVHRPVSSPPPDQIVTSFPTFTMSQPGDSRTGNNPDILVGSMSEADMSTLLNAATNQGGEIISTPRIAQRLGMDAGISVGNDETIAGKLQHLGLKISYFPSRSADGVSLDVGMLVQYIIPTTPPADQ